jgi:acid phosphatase
MRTLSVLLVLSALSSVYAQAPFISGSPVILSAFPNATAAAAINKNAPDAPTGKVFKYFMQIWLENEARLKAIITVRSLILSIVLPHK